MKTLTAAIWITNATSIIKGAAPRFCVREDDSDMSHYPDWIKVSAFPVEILVTECEAANLAKNKFKSIRAEELLAQKREIEKQLETMSAMIENEAAA